MSKYGISSAGGVLMPFYRKLVRDGIPDIIRAKGDRPISHIATPAEFQLALREKLREEVVEYFDGCSPEELCDILEVVYALGECHGLNASQLDALRDHKAAERGTFSGHVILDEVIAQSTGE